MRALLLISALLLPLRLLGASAEGAPRPGFGWPLPGPVVVERGFDPPRSAYGPGHRGVDLRATIGERVLAAGPGRVTYSGLLAGRGVVTVTHAGGLRTTYEPVAPALGVGAQVLRGSVLGTLSTGHASCRHLICLHWGLLRGQVYLDPLVLVEGGPVRLLPLGTTRPSHQRMAAATRGDGSAPSPVAGRQVRDRAAAAVLGGLVLGWTARRRQDARGRPRGGGP